MSLDFTIILAQIANFLLLVWLLKRFLYEPIRRVIAERELRVQEAQNEAERQIQEAKARERSFREAEAKLKAERQRLLDEAVEEANRAREEMLEDARQAYETARQEMHARLQTEKRQLGRQLAEGLVTEACAAAEKILLDLTDANIADAVIDALEKAIETGHDDVQKEADVATSAVADRLQIRTSFEPTDEQQQRLTTVASKWLGGSGPENVEFVHDPRLILGVELIGNGCRAGWSAGERLEGIQERAFARISHGEGEEGMSAGA